jgi:hypothetical protein
MKKDYSKIFAHYYGLQYDGSNLADMIKVHQLMEDAGIMLTASTKDKLKTYSDKRSFKVNYFISKVGRTLKWCPTQSLEKFAKMTLMPAEWWIEQLSATLKTAPAVALPTNWLEVQLQEHLSEKIQTGCRSLGAYGVTYAAEEEDLIVNITEVSVDETEELPF